MESSADMLLGEMVKNLSTQSADYKEGVYNGTVITFDTCILFCHLSKVDEKILEGLMHIKDQCISSMSKAME